jgi:hypothetical protein
MQLTFHGAVRTVTGSMHLVEANGQRILLDCGLYQGRRDEAYARNSTFPFDPRSIDTVILSHSHIDHCGNLPSLIKRGFKGDILCTAATRDLAAVMLRDSAHIQVADTLFVNKIRARQGQRPVFIGLVYIPPSDLTTADAIRTAYDALTTDTRRFQAQGEVLLMGDFNSRVGSASQPNQHIGEWGEPTADAAGAALLDMLRSTDLFALNSRHAHPSQESHSPEYTRRRLLTTADGNTREETSILDYVLLPQHYVITPPGHARPACTLQVETTRRLTNSDHLIMWFMLPHPTNPKTAPSFTQPRPNTFKLTLPTSALPHDFRQQKEQYPSAMAEALEHYDTLLTNLTRAHEQGSLSAQQVCEQAKQALCAGINTAVANTIGFAAPRRHPRKPHNHLWSQEVKAAARARDAAAALLAATPDTQHEAHTTALASLKQAQSAVKSAVAAARAKRTQRLVAEAHSCRLGHDGKGMWKALKTLGGSHRKAAGPAALQDPNGPGLIADDEKVCEILANHYERVSSTGSHYAPGDFDPRHRQDIEQQVQELRLHASHTHPCPDNLSQPLTAPEVAAQCCRLNNNKAPSPLDNVYNELLKYGGDSLSAALAQFFDLQFALETKAKTCGVITPIYKKGDPTAPQNYRPITLGSALDKLYNMVLNSRIMAYLEDNDKLHDAQQGFRPGRSAVDNIYMLHTCLEARCQQKLDTYMLFLDIEKAYDTVWRAGLLWHLWHKGITGKMFRVLAQMLDSTPSCVMHNGAFSRVITPDMGWEQGDTLATTMFTVFINSILEEVWAQHEGVPIPTPADTNSLATKLVALMYADDLVGFATSPARLQAMADHCKAALTKWQLRASVHATDTSKTAYMKVLGGPVSARLHAARRAPPTHTNIMWGDVAIPQVSSYKYLGAWVTNTNTWDTHLDMRMQSADKAAHAHHKAMSQVLLPIHTRKLPLTTVAQPIVTYAAQVWARPTKDMQRKLDSWQAGLAARAFHCPANTSHMCLQQEIGLVPLHITCELLAMRYWHHLSTTPTDRLLYKIHTAWSGKYHPWAKSVNAMLAKYQVTNTEALVLSTAQFKIHLSAKVVDYLRTYWQQPTRKHGPVHERYVSDFGVGETRSARTRVRSYLRELTNQPTLAYCRAAELCMHMRLECLPLRAFHSHLRTNETTVARQTRELCPCCQAHSETPAHFLLECPAYSSLRSPAHIAAAIAQAQATPSPWRSLLADHPATIAHYIHDAWSIRRAALTGRGAYGGNPMALAPVPGPG